MKVTLNELFNNKKKYIGKLINIVKQGGKYHYDYQDIPKMRILTDVQKKTENKVKWIVWRWEQDYTNYDCGYSGIAEGKYGNFNNCYLEV